MGWKFSKAIGWTSSECPSILPVTGGGQASGIIIIIIIKENANSFFKCANNDRGSKEHTEQLRRSLNLRQIENAYTHPHHRQPFSCHKIFCFCTTIVLDTPRVCSLDCNQLLRRWRQWRKKRPFRKAPPKPWKS